MQFSQIWFHSTTICPKGENKHLKVEPGPAAEQTNAKLDFVDNYQTRFTPKPLGCKFHDEMLQNQML